MPSIVAREDAGQHGMTTELNCSEPASLADVHALGTDHVVEAARITGILSGKAAGSGTDNHFVPDEAGVRIHGAWIRGDLNLDGIECVTGLRLTRCRLDRPLTLRAASLRWLVLEECVLSAVWADQATVGTLTIKNSLVSGRYAEGGGLRLAGTRVTADLRLTGTRVDSPAGLGRAPSSCARPGSPASCRSSGPRSSTTPFRARAAEPARAAATGRSACRAPRSAVTWSWRAPL